MQKGYYRKEELAFLQNYANSCGIEYCAKKLNRGLQGVISKCYRKRIKFIHCTPKNDNLQLDTNYIELNLDFKTQKHSKELAYFLGYFWADGYIDKHGAIKLQIVEKDANNIENILTKLATFSIYTKNSKDKQSCKIFCISSQEKASILRNLGKYPHSVESHQTILEYIPEKYRIYFIRGFFDGDGCLSWSKRGSWFSFVGCINQNWTALQEYLGSIGLHLKSKKRSHNNKTGKISYSSCLLNTNSKELYNFFKNLYQEKDGIWLNRKYEKVESFMEYYEEKYYEE